MKISLVEGNSNSIVFHNELDTSYLCNTVICIIRGRYLDSMFMRFQRMGQQATSYACSMDMT